MLNCICERGSSATQETPEMTKAANYYTLGKGRAVVCIEIIDAGNRVQLAEHQVDGKRAARAVAAQYGATPWNF